MVEGQCFVSIHSKRTGAKLHAHVDQKLSWTSLYLQSYVRKINNFTVFCQSIYALACASSNQLHNCGTWTWTSLIIGLWSVTTSCNQLEVWQNIYWYHFSTSYWATVWTSIIFFMLIFIAPGFMVKFNILFGYLQMMVLLKNSVQTQIWNLCKCVWVSPCLSPVRTQILMLARERTAMVSGTPSCSLSSIAVAPRS